MATKEKTNEASFNKAQLLSSAKYTDRRDLLNVLLVDDQEYTFIQVDKAIEEFMNKEVK